MEDEGKKSAAKMELVAITSELMPHGIPMLAETRKYPTIAALVEQSGKKVMRVALLLMVRDFCNSINVVRNMNEDQQIEAAAMLLDECDNFRLEDYHIMFTMAKRNKLCKILDRLDIQVISTIMDEFWLIRNRAGNNAELDKEANRYKKPMTPVSESKVYAAFEEIKEQLTKETKINEEQLHQEWVQKVELNKEMLRNKISLTPACKALIESGMSRDEAIKHLLDLAD